MGQSGMSGLEGLLRQLSEGRGAGGGLDGLLGTLRGAGLGEQVDSWVNTGANRPVAPEELTQAFGAERLDGAAQGLGMQGGALAGILAQLLPALVDRLTPQGQVPSSAAVNDGSGGWGDILGGLLGGGQQGGGGGLGGGLGGVLGGLLGGAQQGGGAQGGGLGEILGGLLGGVQQDGGQALPSAPQDTGPAADTARPAASGGDGNPFSALLRGLNRR